MLLGTVHSGIKVLVHQSYIGRQKITLKVLGFFYNLVAIYYTNSKFILNNKTWYIYCIYIYIKKKKERQREMLKDLGYMHTFPQILAQINMKGKLSHPV